MTEKEFTIREPKLAMGYNILIAFILTLYVAVCYYFMTVNDNKTSTVINLIFLTYFVFRYMVLPGIKTKYVHLNFSEQKIKFESAIGPLSFSKGWKTLDNLEYIAVFNTKNGYDVNLWHNTNQIINLFTDNDVEAVIEKAFIFADKFDIDLLDARERGYHKWIDKDIYRDSKTIKHID